MRPGTGLNTEEAPGPGVRESFLEEGTSALRSEMQVVNAKEAVREAAGTATKVARDMV